jgi:hypothetical protein
MEEVSDNNSHQPTPIIANNQELKTTTDSDTRQSNVSTRQLTFHNQQQTSTTDRYTRQTVGLKHNM